MKRHGGGHRCSLSPPLIAHSPLSGWVTWEVSFEGKDKSKGSSKLWLWKKKKKCSPPLFSSYHSLRGKFPEPVGSLKNSNAPNSLSSHMKVLLSLSPKYYFVPWTVLIRCMHSVPGTVSTRGCPTKATMIISLGSQGLSFLKNLWSTGQLWSTQHN